MYSYADILYFLYLLQIVIGVLGNASVLYQYAFHLITSHKIRLINIIVINLVFSNILVILIRGVPWAIQLLHFKISLDDSGCKIIIFLQRVSQNISLCSTCLLSIFQAITISSSKNRWTELLLKGPKYIILFCMLLWIPILILSMTIFFHVSGDRNSSDSKQSSNQDFCSLKKYITTFPKFIIIKSFHQGVFVVAMIITSSYIMVILFRHYQKIRHTLGSRLTPRGSPEIRATKIILLLVSIFLCFYSVSFIFIIYMNNLQATRQWVIHVSVLLTLCYPAFVPYVLIISDSQISNSCYVFQEIKRSCLYSSTSQTKHESVF